MATRIIRVTVTDQAGTVINTASVEVTTTGAEMTDAVAAVKELGSRVDFGWPDDLGEFE